MSTIDDNVIYAGNVALVHSHDVNSTIPPVLLEQDFLDFTGDVNETVELEVVESKIVKETLETHIEKLFGCWIDGGDDDKHLEELVASRRFQP